MPMIRIELSSGRTPEQKRRVAEAVTAAMVEHCQCRPESVHVVFADVDNHNWAVAGKLLGD